MDWYRVFSDLDTLGGRQGLLALTRPKSDNREKRVQTLNGEPFDRGSKGMGWVAEMSPILEQHSYRWFVKFGGCSRKRSNTILALPRTEVWMAPSRPSNPFHSRLNFRCGTFLADVALQQFGREDPKILLRL